MFKAMGSLMMAFAVMFSGAFAKADVRQLQELAQDVNYAIDSSIDSMGPQQRQRIGQELDYVIQTLSSITRVPSGYDRGIRGMSREVLRQLGYVYDIDYSTENQIAESLMRVKRIAGRGDDRPYPPYPGPGPGPRPPRPIPPGPGPGPIPPRPIPPRPMPPRPPVSDISYLCAGTFNGSYANGAAGQFTFSIAPNPTNSMYRVALNVQIILNGRQVFGGNGTCQLNRDGSASVVMNMALPAPQHQGTISADGRSLTGSQVGGFAFSAFR